MINGQVGAQQNVTFLSQRECFFFSPSYEYYIDVCEQCASMHTYPDSDWCICGMCNVQMNPKSFFSLQSDAKIRWRQYDVKDMIVWCVGSDELIGSMTTALVPQIKTEKN